MADARSGGIMHSSSSSNTNNMGSTGSLGRIGSMQGLQKQSSKSSLFNETQVQDLAPPTIRSRRGSQGSIGDALHGSANKLAVQEEREEPPEDESPRQRSDSVSSSRSGRSGRNYIAESSSNSARSAIDGDQKQTPDNVDALLSAARQAAGAYTKKPNRPPKQTLKVLIVEDNPLNQKTAQRMVKLLGYETDVASNGLEAMTKLKSSIDSRSSEQPFDVILMDLHMPEMDGFQTTKLIRAMFDEAVRPTIISVTASESPEESMKCLALGFAHYVAKPIMISELSSLLSKCKMVGAPAATSATAENAAPASPHGSQPQSHTSRPHRSNNLHSAMQAAHPPNSNRNSMVLTSRNNSANVLNTVADEGGASNNDEASSLTDVAGLTGSSNVGETGHDDFAARAQSLPRDRRTGATRAASPHQPQYTNLSPSPLTLTSSGNDDASGMRRSRSNSNTTGLANTTQSHLIYAPGSTTTSAPKITISSTNAVPNNAGKNAVKHARHDSSPLRQQHTANRPESKSSSSKGSCIII